MSDWENWEAEADKPVIEVKKDNQFADEVDEAIDIDAKQEIKVEKKAPNPEKVIEIRFSFSNSFF